MGIFVVVNEVLTQGVSHDRLNLFLLRLFLLVQGVCVCVCEIIYPVPSRTICRIQQLYIHVRTNRVIHFLTLT
jgi:hypothetical protein